MIETEIKEMLKDIIDNGAEYEVKTPEDICLNALIGGEYLPYDLNKPVVDVELEWKPYKLGDEIHSDWKYRKVEKWYVSLINGYRSICGNWYETKRLAILDWNRFRAIGRDGIHPRRNNFFLRQPEKYWPNGDLK